MGRVSAVAVPGAMHFDFRFGNRVELHFSSDRQDVIPEASHALAAKVHILRGADPTRWRTDIPLFGRITYAGLWEGIDLVYYGNDGRLEHDFVLAPGADPNSIGMEIRAAGQPSLDEQGNLVIPTAESPIRLTRPVAYQQIGDQRVDVAASFVLRNPMEVAFEVGAYDPSLPLVIDPVLEFSTVFGGSLVDEVYGVVFDSEGNLFAAGRTESPEFQATPGAYQETIDFCTSTYCTTDAFVAMFAPNGDLLWATYLGGGGYEGAFGVAVDTEGYPTVAGKTDSIDFPTTVGAYHETCVGMSPYDTCDGAFATKLSRTGSAIVWSTFVGGLYNSDTQTRAMDEGGPIAIDATDYVFLAGDTQSGFFPTTEGAFQESFGGAGDTWVGKLLPDGSDAVWATYIGGSGTDSGARLAIDPTGAVYVSAVTDSPSLPGASGFQPTPPGGISDSWVVKLDPSGSTAIYATYLGGSDNFDSILGLAVDAAGFATVTGQTKSEDFPLVNALQGSNIWTSTTGDGFAARIAPDGSELIYSTYLGGQFFDNGWDVDIDGYGNALVIGTTNSPGMPTTDDAFQPELALNDDVFLTVLNGQGGLEYGTYFGGSTRDHGFVVASGPGDRVALGGTTTSSDFWRKNSIKSIVEPFDAYVAVLNIPEPGAALLQGFALASVLALAGWRGEARPRRSRDHSR
jgi:hypothetical protein